MITNEPGDVDVAAKPAAGAGRFRRALPRDLIIVGLLTTIATAAGYLGFAWTRFDLLAHFRFQYTLVLAAVMIGLVAMGRRRWVLVFALPLGLNLAAVTPLYVRPQPVPANVDAQPTLRLLTFNVSAANRRYDEVAAYLHDSGADLILILEVTPAWYDQLDRTVRAAGRYRFVASDVRPGAFGIALLAADPPHESAFEFHTARTFELTRDAVEIPSIEATVSLAGRRICVLGTHPLPPVRAWAAAHRDEQLAAAGRWAGEHRPAVVFGDLNATPWSHGFKKLTRSGDLINSQRGRGYQPTWSNFGWQVNRIPIDHCLHSRELVTLTRHVGRNLGSDHNALHVELTWAGESQWQTGPNSRDSQRSLAPTAIGTSQYLKKH